MNYPTKIRNRLAAVAASAVLGAGLLLAPAADAQAVEPGAGKTVNMARATWDTGYFHAEIYRKALQALGYKVPAPKDLQNPIFYQSVGLGDVDLWVNGWFPGHGSYKDAYEQGAELVGYVAKGGALQGYLVDKKTADALNIKSLSDFKRPEVREAYDSDGDGKAEMVACPPGWGCEIAIDFQFKAYELLDDIELIKASYSASMADAIAKYESGQPVFFYTWTPNWVVDELKPGKDVVWVEVPFLTLPEDQAGDISKAEVADVEGCVANPCKMGHPANDIRPVANTAFLNANPAVRKLLEVMSIPLADINAQNAKMFNGEDSKEDVERHAEEWVAAHQDTFNGWLEEARAAAK
jgi:glycine betaine/proline transport system substrate-binding protein